MAAFDVTTKPLSLTLKPGATATLTVVVSNRLGKPVMGRIETYVTPVEAAPWVVAPAERQRRFEADPAATLAFEFQVTVPPGTTTQAVQFRADVVDVLAPDDNFGQGETVAINVAAAANGGGGKPGIPWWVWLVAAVVLIGAGIGIYLLVRPRGVPDVRGLVVDEARARLEEKGFANITVRDSLTDGPDTTVVKQTPEPKADLPDEAARDTFQVELVVSRPSTTVPRIVGQHIAVAVERLREAGLRVGRVGGRWTPTQSLDDQVADASPAQDSPVATGQAVTLIVWSYSPTKPPACQIGRRCVVKAKAKWSTVMEARRIP